MLDVGKYVFAPKLGWGSKKRFVVLPLLVGMMVLHTESYRPHWADYGPICWNQKSAILMSWFCSVYLQFLCALWHSFTISILHVKNQVEKMAKLNILLHYWLLAFHFNWSVITLCWQVTRERVPLFRQPTALHNFWFLTAKENYHAFYQMHFYWYWLHIYRGTYHYLFFFFLAQP